METEIIDVWTGQLLAAGVDNQIGGKDIVMLVNSWDDVNKILNLCSKLLVSKLCEAQGKA
jgi:hypothetical protein